MYGKHSQQQQRSNETENQSLVCTIAEKFDRSICRLFDWNQSFVVGFSLGARHSRSMSKVLILPTT
jgi:hypothetical protein